jgi:hypothetical protein
MKNLFIFAAIVTMLSGCVVTPAGRVYVPMIPVVPAAPPPVIYETVPYPVYESQYYFDPTVGIYFFVYGGHRHYMPRSWGYHSHGVPHGYYRR